MKSVFLAALFIAGVAAYIYVVAILPTQIESERDAKLAAYCDQRGGSLIQSEDICIVGTDVVGQSGDTFVIILPSE